MEDLNNNYNNNTNKKKNKRTNKKKNKNKTTEDDAVSIGAVDHENGVNNNAAVLHGSDTDQNNNGTEISTSMEAEKQQWLQREAFLEERIKQLQSENDSKIQREEILRKSIKQLQEENGTQLQKQIALEGTINELRNANDSALEKEVTLDETIKELRNANDLALQNVAELEKKNAQLRSEKDLYLPKEAGLEEKLQCSLNENVALVQKVANLEEKIKQLENSKDSGTLAKVVELEESRNILLKENQHLMENISDLRLQLQNFETNILSANTSHEPKKHALEREDLESQIEAACALVDKLITENAELIEKVNELYIKLDRQNSAAAVSSAVDRDIIPRNVEITHIADSTPESSESVSVGVHKLASLEVEPAANGLPYASGAYTGEIMQIPLDENELRDLELQAVENDKVEPVPITDAPLTGAPFRLISFVANYVSGVDLVEKNTSSSGS